MTLLQAMIYFLLGCACVVAVAFTWGFVEHYFKRRQPIRVSTNAARRLRWLVDEIKKELDKGLEAP